MTRTATNPDSLVTTYLESRAHLEMRSANRESRNKDLQVRELTERDWKFNREMYFKVGENWDWIDKQPWTDEQWKEYASDPGLRTFAGYCGEALVGYYELKRSAASLSEASGHRSPVTGQREEEVEIAYFGLLPEFIGRGLGSALLTSAIENAWAWSPAPSRVWVHTCNRDHPAALANYQARGFVIYKVESDVRSATGRV